MFILEIFHWVNQLWMNERKNEKNIKIWKLWNFCNLLDSFSLFLFLTVAAHIHTRERRIFLGKVLKWFYMCFPCELFLLVFFCSGLKVDFFYGLVGNCTWRGFNLNLKLTFFYHRSNNLIYIKKRVHLNVTKDRIFSFTFFFIVLDAMEKFRCCQKLLRQKQNNETVKRTVGGGWMTTKSDDFCHAAQSSKNLLIFFSLHSYYLRHWFRHQLRASWRGPEDRW